MRSPRPAPLPRHAFTLIELLAVVAIVGVLAAILFVVLGRARDAARTAQGASNLRELGQATLLYASDHRNVYPPTYDTPVNGVPVTNTTWWWELFPAYCNSAAVFADPTDQTGFSGTYTSTWTRNGQTLPNGKVSYGALGHMDGTVNFKPLGYPVAAISAPARTVLYIDHQSPDARLSETWDGNQPRWVNATDTSPENSEYPTFPHSGKANMVFLDGHIALMSQPAMVAAEAAGTLLGGQVSPL